MNRAQEARRIGGSLAISVAAIVMGAGCATVDPNASGLKVPAAQPALEALLQQAQSETQQGLHDQSRRTLREAAMAYPAAKEPWLRLAEDYFRSSDYGNAILAAQEVVQRDNKNPVAQSVLAVSGLRVSAQALGELRDRSRFEVGSKGEAVELTRQMRVHLGEPVLVPLKAGGEAESDSNAPAPRTRTAPPAGRNPTPPAPRKAAVVVEPSSAVKPIATNPAPATAPAPSARATPARPPQPAAAAKPAPPPPPRGNPNPFNVLD